MHIVVGPLLVSLISWLPASAILFVTRKVRVLAAHSFRDLKGMRGQVDIEFIVMRDGKVKSNRVVRILGE